MTKTSNVLISFQSGRIELASETYLIVPDQTSEDFGTYGDDIENKIYLRDSAKKMSTSNLFRIYKSKLLTKDLNFENVVKGKHIK